MSDFLTPLNVGSAVVFFFSIGLIVGLKRGRQQGYTQGHIEGYSNGYNNATRHLKERKWRDRPTQ